MSTPRSCRFPPTPRLSERKRALFTSPICNLSPHNPILSEISNTPRRSNRILNHHLTPVRECNENITPSSRGTAHTPLYLSGDSSDLGHMSPLESSSSPIRYDSPFHTSPEIDSPSALLARTRFFNKRNLKFDGLKNKDLDDSHLDENLEVDIRNISIDPETPRKDFSGIFNRKLIVNEKVNSSKTSSILSDARNQGKKILDIESLLDADTVIPETPEKISPTHHLRTPQEHFSENLGPPKLHSRKSFSEANSWSPVAENNLLLKRKQTSNSFDSPNKKHLKLDDNPKARASLFPETSSLFSTKSFYSNNQSTKEYQMPPANKNNGIRNTKNITVLKKRGSPVSFRRYPRRSAGQINFGVKHKIRKPRAKRTSLNTSFRNKKDLLDSAIDIIDNSPLNDYLNNVPVAQRHSMPSSLNALSNNENQSNVEKPFLNRCVYDIKPNKNFSIALNIATDENCKENSEPIPGRKFFKSRMRSLTNKIVTIQDNIVVNIKAKSNKPKIEKESAMTIDLPINNNTDRELLNSSEINEGNLSQVQTEVEKLLSEWHESDESVIENAPASIIQSETHPVNLIDMAMLEAQRQLALIDSTIAVLSSSQTENDTNGLLEIGVDNMNSSPMLTDSGALSPTSQISSMTSFMALDSPILESTLSTRSEIFEIQNQNINEEKLYSLFYKDNVKNSIEEPITKTRQKKIWKPNGAQYQIDAGQKKFGATQCNICGLLYQIADPEEELFHFNYHNSLHVLNFQGWRNEPVISVLANVGRIIHIKYNAPKSWHKRVADLYEIIDNELGIVSTPYEPSEATQAYLMVNNKQIIGLAIATKLVKANRMIPSSDFIELCTAEEYDVKCGISRIWIAPPFRGRGIALSILNALRCNFMFGRILDLDEIAFSTPTPDGLSLAKKFFRRDDFLVFSGC